MALTDKDAIKEKLGIADSGSDDALAALAAAVSGRILALTGRSDGAQAGVVETYRQVQQGRPFFLKLRPVEQVTQVEYRPLGDNTFGAIGYDLLDPDRGELMVTGVLLGWPPIQPYPPSFTRWRAVRYPVVRVTYDVADGTLDGRLQDLAASWGAYLFDREQFGAASKQQIGRVVREMMTQAMPSWVSGGLTPFIPSTAAVH